MGRIAEALVLEKLLLLTYQRFLYLDTPVFTNPWEGEYFRSFCKILITRKFDFSCFKARRRDRLSARIRMWLIFEEITYMIYSSHASNLAWKSVLCCCYLTSLLKIWLSIYPFLSWSHMGIFAGLAEILPEEFLLGFPWIYCIE